MATKPIEPSPEAKKRARELGVKITNIYVLRDLNAKKPSRPQPVDRD